jgi:predicted membrane protein
MFKNKANVVLGTILIVLGIFISLNHFTDLDLGWLAPLVGPSLIIMFGLFLIIKHGRSKIGFIILFIGLISLLSQIFDYNIWNLWPIGIILIGIITMIGFPSWNKGEKSSVKATGEDSIDEAIVFWGLEKRIRSQNFRGGKITVLFGGAEIDLREAKISAKGAALDVSAIFGGVEIKVPSQDVRVINQGTGFLGAFEDNCNSSNKKNAPIFKITGSAVFGGVEIK